MSIETQWQEIADCPPMQLMSVLGPEILEVIKNAFYGGALAALMEIIEALKQNQGEGIVVTLTSLENEIEAFYKSTRTGVKQP